MEAAFIWYFGDPWHYYSGMVITFFGGIMVGRSLSTRKLEIQRDDARRDLWTLQRAIEIVNRKN